MFNVQCFAKVTSLSVHFRPSQTAHALREKGPRQEDEERGLHLPAVLPDWYPERPHGTWRVRSKAEELLLQL